MSDATKIGDELHELVQGRIPATRLWQREIYLGTGPRPDSENKWWGCNAAEARFAQLKGDLARVRQILDFTADWVTTHPFTEGEELTPEEVYRGLMAFGAYTLAGVALATGHPGYRQILEHAAAHPGWCLLPSAPGPGLSVVDHRLGRVGQNVVLVGDGPVISDLPYVAQAGMRGWVRRRDKGSTAEFLFADRKALSMIVAQAAGRQRRRSAAPNEFDRFEAIREAFTGPAGEQLPSWGFTPAQQQVAQAFLADPTDTTLLVEILSWLRGHVPGLPFKITRFVDGSVFMQLLRSRKSSTDCVAGDGWFRVPGTNHGITKKMSAGTGARSGGAGDDDVKPMRGWEDATAWYCQDADGSDTGEPPQSIAKPAGLAIAWTVEVTEDGRVVARDGSGRELGGAQAPAPPAPSPAPSPAPAGGGKKRKKRGGCAIFFAVPAIAALAWVLA